MLQANINHAEPAQTHSWTGFILLGVIYTCLTTFFQCSDDVMDHYFEKDFSSTFQIHSHYYTRIVIKFMFVLLGGICATFWVSTKTLYQVAFVLSWVGFIIYGYFDYFAIPNIERHMNISILNGKQFSDFVFPVFIAYYILSGAFGLQYLLFAVTFLSEIRDKNLPIAKYWGVLFWYICFQFSYVFSFALGYSKNAQLLASLILISVSSCLLTFVFKRKMIRLVDESINFFSVFNWDFVWRQNNYRKRTIKEAILYLIALTFFTIADLQVELFIYELRYLKFPTRVNQNNVYMFDSIPKFAQAIITIGFAVVLALVKWLTKRSFPIRGRHRISCIILIGTAFSIFALFSMGLVDFARLRVGFDHRDNKIGEKYYRSSSLSVFFIAIPYALKIVGELLAYVRAISAVISFSPNNLKYFNVSIIMMAIFMGSLVVVIFKLKVYACFFDVKHLDDPNSKAYEYFLICGGGHIGFFICACLYSYYLPNQLEPNQEEERIVAE